MKKRILSMVLLMVVSFMVSIPKINAKYMILKCDRNPSYVPANEKIDNLGGRPMWPVILTDNEGNSSRVIVDNLYFDAGNLTDGQFQENEFSYRPITASCWLNSNMGEINSLDCTKQEDIYPYTNKSIFEDGICPKGYRASRSDNDYVVPFGQMSDNHGSASIDESKLVIYQFKDDDDVRTIVEAYSDDGTYAYIGPNLVVSGIDEIIWHQVRLFANIYRGSNRKELDFFNVSEKFKTLMISGNGITDSDIALCAGLDMDGCKAETEFTVLLTTSNSESKEFKDAKTVGSYINEWLSNNNEKIKGLETIINKHKEANSDKTVFEKEEFINTCYELNEAVKNNRKYNFNSNYSSNELISDLMSSKNLIKELYEENEKKFTMGVTSEAMTYILNDLGVNYIQDFAWKDNDEYKLNVNLIRFIMLKHVENEIKKVDNFTVGGIDLLNIYDFLDEKMLLFFETATYLNSGVFDLTTKELSELDEIIRYYESIAEKRELTYYVSDCKGLLGQSLLDKINSYINIVKIAIPIILIGLGIVDFTKAVFVGDEQTMKKSQMTFIKRLGIAIVFFLIPTLVNLILNLANKVWPIIIPNSCGIFENETKVCYKCNTSVGTNYVWDKTGKFDNCQKEYSIDNEKDCNKMNN